MKSSSLIYCLVASFYLLFIGCDSDIRTTRNGFMFEYFKGTDIQKASVNDIAKYRFYISDKKTDFPNDSLLTEGYFKMVDSVTLSQFNNPIYDILGYLNVKDSAYIYYEKNKFKKYPPEYGQGTMAYIWVVLDEVYSEGKMAEIQKTRRLKILDERQNYYNQLPFVDSLVKLQFSSINSAKIKPDTVMNDVIQVFNLEFRDILDIKKINKDFITLSYSAYLPNGKRVFSSFENREPYVTDLKSTKIPPGWRIVLQSITWDMPVLCKIPAEYLYAEKGFEGNVKIPPNTDLWFYFVKN